MSPFVARIIHDLKQLLYPAKCIGCGGYIDADPKVSAQFESCFCPRCILAGYFPIETPYCTLCGVQLPRTGAENHLCQVCLRTPLKLGKVRAAAQYRGVLKETIHQLKYKTGLSVADLLGGLLFQAFDRHFTHSSVDMILPVPLHKKRAKERGFNQAYILVRRFRKHYEKQYRRKPEWEVNTTALVRERRTAPQTGLDITLRKKNLKGAFAAVDSAKIENRHILLVDDVMTTGATCNEAAKVLLQNGAARVDALVLARA